MVDVLEDSISTVKRRKKNLIQKDPCLGWNNPTIQNINNNFSISIASNTHRRSSNTTFTSTIISE
jgi:hypothetical protein